MQDGAVPIRHPESLINSLYRAQQRRVICWRPVPRYRLIDVRHPVFAVTRCSWRPFRAGPGCISRAALQKTSSVLPFVTRIIPPRANGGEHLNITCVGDILLDYGVYDSIRILLIDEIRGWLMGQELSVTRIRTTQRPGHCSNCRLPPQAVVNNRMVRMLETGVGECRNLCQGPVHISPQVKAKRK